MSCISFARLFCCLKRLRALPGWKELWSLVDLLGLTVRTCLKPVLVQHWQVWEKEVLVSR